MSPPTVLDSCQKVESNNYNATPLLLLRRRRQLLLPILLLLLVLVLRRRIFRLCFGTDNEHSYSIHNNCCETHTYVCRCRNISVLISACTRVRLLITCLRRCFLNWMDGWMDGWMGGPMYVCTACTVCTVITGMSPVTRRESSSEALVHIGRSSW